VKFKGFTSQVVHHDRLRGLDSGAVHAPITNSVLFGYEQVQGLVDVFQGKRQGHAYARQSTPTHPHLQSLISQLEQGRSSLLFGTGMAAITAIFMALLQSGDHLIASRFLFGNTHSLINTLERFGVKVSLVDTTKLSQIDQAIQENTRMVFLETLANPGTQIPDFEPIAKLCDQHQLIFVVDNTLTTPYLFQPATVGAHLSVSSLTKYFCGHANALGGCVTDTGRFNWQNFDGIYSNYRKNDPADWGMTQIRKKALRDMGASLSPQACSQLAIGAETLALRMERACSNALAVAQFLDQHPLVSHVYYPGLTDHPQHELAKKYFRHFGGLVSFDLVDTIDPLAFLDKLSITINATHLGDNRTLALPVAQTIFYEMGPENRRAQGIKDHMIRCSVGIEDEEDLLSSFSEALAQF